MQCAYPLKAWPDGMHESGKPKYKITGYSVKSYNGRTDFQEIPCGKCLPCRLNKSRDWSLRCMLEATYHEDNYYLTLTYDDDHLTRNELLDPITGEIYPSPLCTLVKKDMQDFWKRLRRRTGQDIRYLMCGEYGDKGHRPHYHAIVFGLKLTDLEIYKQNFQGDLLYTSFFLNSVWKKGFVVVGDVTISSCNYVARYVTKKLYGKLAERAYDDNGIVPPYNAASNRPGLAYQFYLDNKDKIGMYDSIVLATDSGGKLFKPP